VIVAACAEILPAALAACADRRWVGGLLRRPEATIVAEQWRRHYTEGCPRSSFGYLTPVKFKTGTKRGQLAERPSTLGVILQ
jgi:hypothetical protein